MSNEPAIAHSPYEEIENKVQFLKQANSYPHKPKRVDVLETHTSWIFLADEYVYKLKKPLQYDFLDFSTVEARRRNCEAEVRLNRRLADDVYLGVVPLILDEQGDIRLGGCGHVIDWLVKMQRLPSRQVLENQIKKGTVDGQDIVKLALLLSRFYEQAPPVDITASDYRKRFEEDIHASLEELKAPEFGLSMERVQYIAQGQLNFLAREDALLKERVHSGRIIEAHGDLRPEHIYLGERPVIVDCLEFNREFRIMDPADELAFLAMECERLGAFFVGDILLTTYRGVTSDNPPEQLSHFYMSYRAMLWAKLAIRHICRHSTGERSKWVRRTNDYLRLAEAHIQQT